MNNNYLDLIKTALSGITKDYFRLQTTYASSGIVRERLFCYELYHQMRKLDPNPDILIHGEIDKSGHKHFEDEDKKNPDFVFHVPGTFESNFLVVEVKGNLDLEGIEKDFRTIATFIESYQYKAGVFILYNHSLNELIRRSGHILKDFKKRQSASSIYILSMDRPFSECEVILFSNLNIE
jgi:hypothetical protein